MSFLFRKILLLTLLIVPFLCEAKLPELSPKIVQSKITEIMKMHASHKQLSPLLIKRSLSAYIEELDPNKSYFIEPDIHLWIEPTDPFLEKIYNEVNEGNYQVFYQIHEAMAKAILRRHELEKQILDSELPKHVKPQEFKEMKWAENDQELLNRIMRIKGLQAEAASKLSDDLKEKSLQRISKRQAKYEEDILSNNTAQKENFILSNTLKALASSLDSHTSYFTPDEAAQFMINVQQRLFGIGAQLRDDINGFSVIKIIDGGPAAVGRELKIKDRIIAVNGEPVVGMDIADAVELIRGQENTPVTLTVIRETGDKEEEKKEEKLDIVILRGEVVLKETRYESSYEPFGQGVIAYLQLHSFYQDNESSSTTDLANELKKIQNDHQVKGLILDLRFNSGGMLSQAVGVAGLFITKGTVVSIKDDSGNIQHLRDLDGKAQWDGPLIILVNRASASASEIVAGTLQDYGRALIVGDDHTYGKGSFQTFTLNSAKNSVNPEGEYKVTRGRYYTVSGKTPQLTGVLSDIIVPGSLVETEIGEKYTKFPLENDQIEPNFDDDLSDVPFSQRGKVRLLYKFDLQPKLTTYQPYLDTLTKNSAHRIEHNKNYQNFLKEIKKKDEADEEQEMEHFGQNDLQLNEAYNIMKDLILLMH